MLPYSFLIDDLKNMQLLYFKTNPKHLILPMKTQERDGKWNPALSERQRKHPVDLTHPMSQKEKVPFLYRFKYCMNSTFFLYFLCIFVSILQTTSHSQCYFLMFIHCQLVVYLSMVDFFFKSLLQKALVLKMCARTEQNKFLQ